MSYRCLLSWHIFTFLLLIYLAWYLNADCADYHKKRRMYKTLIKKQCTLLLYTFQSIVKYPPGVFWLLAKKRHISHKRCRAFLSDLVGVVSPETVPKCLQRQAISSLP